MTKPLSNEQYVEMINTAQVYQAAHRTALQHAPKLSKKLNRQIFLKREDQQPVFSFKIRGAANKIFTLTPEELKSGVICSSAGNHAQGVAMAAAARSIPAHIVMPISAPAIKVEAVESFGAKVTLHGDHYDEAQTKAYEIAEKEDLCFIHPFNDPLVIAGQGTIAKEILEQTDEIAAIFVPIGGGGLASGIATYAKTLNPNILVIGVEPEEAASMQKAFQENGPCEIEDVGIFADGVAVKKVGEETYRLCKEHLDEIITVTTDQTCAAIQDIFEDTRTVVEPAGALALAGIRKYFKENPESPLGSSSQTIAAIVCGANMNFERLRHVSERAAIGKDREALFTVQIPEERGSFLNFCATIGDRAITEFNYRSGHHKTARIFVGIENGGSADTRKEIINHLENSNYKATDLTENELAKLHLRHLTPGSDQHIKDERLYRFQFPERRGALRKFLEAIGEDFNITLFHYRNHGSDYGRVLAGIQVPDMQLAEFQDHLNTLGYKYWDETENEGYQEFLK